MNKKFTNSLELLTPDGKYNYIAYLLADEKWRYKYSIDIIKNAIKYNCKKISEQTGFSTRKINRIIKELRETGVIVRVGSNKKDIGI